MEEEEEENGGSGRKKQGSDGSGLQGCRGPDIETAVAGIFESSESDSSKERSSRVAFLTEHPPQAVVEVTCESIYMKGGRG